MSFEPTTKNLSAFAREQAPEGVDIDAFYAAFKEADSHREDEYYFFYIEHVASGKVYMLQYEYDSWDGIGDDLIATPIVVEQKEVTVTQWVAVK